MGDTKKQVAPTTAPTSAAAESPLVAMTPPAPGLGPLFIEKARYDVVGGVVHVPVEHVAAAEAKGYTPAE